MKKVLLNWSGGKDSSLCLFKLMKNSEYKVCGLLTSVNGEKGRVSMHGIRDELLRNQAHKIAIPLDCLILPDQINMHEYNQLMKDKLLPYGEGGINCCAFGDIFLEDLRNYREKKLAEINMEAIFPLWNKSTDELAHEFVDLGFKAVISSVDGSKLDASFVGREYNHQFLKDLPDEVDSCGEHGEFHTFVYDGPIFNAPVSFTKGQIVERTYEPTKDSVHSFADDSDQTSSFSYWFMDLLPGDSNP
jgi:uncharacterized protein (TIGR00290 family)